MARAAQESLYDILEVTPAATADEIKASYRRLAAQYHPDRHQNNPLADLAAAKLVALNQAYEGLSDPARRAAYDAELAGARGGQRGPGFGGAAAPIHREARRLALVLRLLWMAAALLLVIRLIPVIWRFVSIALRAAEEALAALAGTPALAIGVAIAVAAMIAISLRHRAKNRRRASSRHPQS